MSCRAQEDKFQDDPLNSLIQIPAGFPPIPIPADNSINLERYLLGKKLFYNPIMSRDSSISCASCHRPELAFSDQEIFSKGVGGAIGSRNSPSLANVAYHPYFTREGGVSSLEMQILVPVQEHAEFDFNILRIVDRLNQDSQFIKMSLEAYGRLPDPFVITRSISCFERTLISGNSRFDKFQNENKKYVLSVSETRGMDLFFSKRTQCSFCHSGFNFTNYAFENNGLYKDYLDFGRFRLTGDTADLARFKVPSLRNIEVTSPYMHDGSFPNLEAVIEHYNEGGKPNVQKNQLIVPLHLTKQEKKDLVAFLKSLTDIEFIQNPKFR